ncbi:MAG: aspartate kinase, partial [Endomicrobiia bacterium]|nr:aspartate kinase [Endomicrobiia bacterium]
IALLTMAIKARGVGAISLTGSQAGIYADSCHTRARITKIIPTKIKRELSGGNVVIVAGFQGRNPNDDIATLGRGGSDLTAVALSAALGADECEIYTDVDGVYTTDPRVARDARKINIISYDEMLEMAGTGAQVMQGRSVEVAKKYGVNIRVLSSFVKSAGTLITQEPDKEKQMEAAVVRAVTFDRNQAKFSILDVADRPGIASKIFGALALAGINVDMIIQSAARQGSNDISFTVSRADAKKSAEILRKLKKRAGASGVIEDKSAAKVSIIGVGMKSHPGVAAKMFATLASSGVNIEMISTSEIKVSCIVSEKQVDKAVGALHKAFALGEKNLRKAGLSKNEKLKD